MFLALSVESLQPATPRRPEATPAPDLDLLMSWPGKGIQLLRDTAGSKVGAVDAQHRPGPYYMVKKMLKKKKKEK